MKSLVYHGVRDIRLENVSDPIVSQPDSAIVRISACSICGSDLHPYHVNDGRSAFCIGHEAVGEVVETGRGVTRFRPGDRVLLMPSLSCGQCDACRANNSMMCEILSPRVFGQGIPGIGGCQAEAVEVPVADFNMYALSSDMPDEVGLALTDTLPTAWCSARRGGVGPGHKVAVIGLGAVGLQAVLAAFAQGAEAVFGIDLVTDRRLAAAALGATPVDGAAAAPAIAEATRGLGADVVIDANGSQATFDLALNLVRKGGRISIIGVPEAATLTFPAGYALMKNIDICYAVCSVQRELPDVLAAIETGRISQDALVGLFTHRMDLDQGPEAYALFDSRADGVKKILMRC